MRLRLLLLLLLPGLPLLRSADETFGRPSSILVVVSVKWKDTATESQRQAVLDGLLVMARKVPGIRNVWIRSPKVAPPEYHNAFVLEFADRAALQAFGPHPAHQEWEKLFLPIREESRAMEITN